MAGLRRRVGELSAAQRLKPAPPMRVASLAVLLLVIAGSASRAQPPLMPAGMVPPPRDPVAELAERRARAIELTARAAQSHRCEVDSTAGVIAGMGFGFYP
jgi:hypothetical protein